MDWDITLTEVGIRNFIIKFAYLKTIPAIFKIVELVVAIILTSVVAYYFNQGFRVSGDILFLLVSATCFICSFCLFLSEWIVWSTVNSSSKSMFEIIFFIVSSILLITSSVQLILNIQGYRKSHNLYSAYLINSILGLVLMAIYWTDTSICFCLNSIRNHSDPVRKIDSNE